MAGKFNIHTVEERCRLVSNGYMVWQWVANCCRFLSMGFIGYQPRKSYAESGGADACYAVKITGRGQGFGMKQVWPVLLVAAPETLAQLQLDELQRSFGCQIRAAPGLEELRRVTSPLHLLVVELCEQNAAELLALVQQGALAHPFEHLILFQWPPFAVCLDPFWSCGLLHYVPLNRDPEPLYSVLNHHFSQQQDLRNLHSQLREASDIALLSMSASSQLGEIIRFLERSYACRTCDALGILLNQTLERLGVAGCGLIETGQQLFYFGADDRREAWQRLMQEMRSKGRFVDLENRTITNFDSISVMARNMPEPGSEPYGRMKDMLFTLVEGAEARVRTLALEQAAMLSEKAKSTFMMLMSHELRTPMNAILGFSSRLADKPVGESVSAREASALRMIHESAERMMELIEDLQDLSSIAVDSGQARNRVLVADALAEVFRLTEQKAVQKGLVFSRTLAETGLQAEVDAARLHQVVKKLCLNAVKYTDHGEVGVRVASAYDRNRGEQLVIEVRDTGKGIPAERLPHLFQPFTHFYADVNHHQQGTGLGLAVVREFVGEMGGQVEVESVPEQGSVFRIRLPQFVTHVAADEVELF